jgi:NIPSNAP
MIYQHRLVLAQPGKLQERHARFEGENLSALDAHGSTLVGAWEVWIGREAGRAVFQLRQFESMAAWAEHQDRVRADSELAARRQTNLFPHLDFIETAIVRLADGSPALPTEWPAVSEVRGQPRGFYEQRTLYLRPDQPPEHHRFYFEELAPALERDGSRLIGLFDTVIGPGSTNAGSHRSIELRWFADLGEWQRWREDQEHDPALVQLKEAWLSRLAGLESVLLRPLDYSRMR